MFQTYREFSVNASKFMCIRKILWKRCIFRTFNTASSATLLQKTDVGDVTSSEKEVAIDKDQPHWHSKPAEEFKREIGYVEKKRKPSRDPFVKNLLRGVYDTDVLAYPEPLEKAQLNSLVENATVISKYFETVDSDEIDKNRKIPDDVIATMKELKLFGQKIPAEYGGLNFTETEYARTMEAMSQDISVALLQYTHEILSTKPILLYGTEDQKNRYLRKLATGEWLASYCLAEEETGTDMFKMNTMATSLNDDMYSITGEKSWVVNAQDADFFIVYAKTHKSVDDPNTITEGNTTSFYFREAIYNIQPCDVPNILRSNGFTAFLVEKSFNGITVGEPVKTFGVRGLNICNVKFDDTKVPAANVLGEENDGHRIVASTPANDRYVYGSIAISRLKTLTRDLAKYTFDREVHNEKLCSFGLVQEKIATINMYIYAIESMVYLTSGRMDMYENTDYELEGSIIKIFSTEAVWKCANECMQLFGMKGYMEEFPYQRYVRDVRVLSLFDVNNELMRLYIALFGLEHLSKLIRDNVYKSRNVLHFPNFSLVDLWKRRRQENDDPHMYLKLYQFLHPSFRYLGDMLEYCVLRYEYAVHSAVCRHGPLIAHCQPALKRIADVAVGIYAMTAVLSRLSRSYCIGLEYCTEEAVLVDAFVRDTHEQLKRQLDELIAGQYFSTDDSHMKLSKHCIEHGGYFMTHPLTDNF